MPQIDQPEQPGDTFLPKFSYFRGLKETEDKSDQTEAQESDQDDDCI
jgi:hypothetical protein